MAGVEELEQKLNQLTDAVIAIAQKQDATAEVVANLSRTQARTAENNARVIQALADD